MARLAINGFGRIGRAAAKIALDFPDFDLVAINDLTDAETLISLLRYDSVYGIYNKKIEVFNDSIKINDNKIHFYQEEEPKNLPWQALDVDVVIESTGVFLTSKKCNDHISAGAKKVVMSAPAKDDETPTYLIGVNEDQYRGENIISNASCTTNCIAPIIKILNDKFGVKQSLMTTIHSYTADQNLVDGPHKDLRRARAAAMNIVPTTTGAAKSVAKIIKDLDNKFDGLSIRVPTPIVSIADIVAVLEKPTTIEEINREFERVSQVDLKNILAVTDNPVVSSDFIGNEMSAIVDLSLTNVVGGNLVKVIAWYDNEWGYSKRLVEIASLISRR
jgi:glyceraldehyde 3-phosphate dehydrogenase